MSETENKHEKESKLWMIGMVGVIIAVAIFVAVAIFLQHQQLSVEANAVYSSKQS